MAPAIINLNQIVRSFYVADIQNTPLLFHRESGEVSSINSSAALLINLAQSGLSNAEIISEVSVAHAVTEQQIHQDLDDLGTHLKQIQTAEESNIETDDGQMDVDDFIALDYSQPHKTCFYKIAKCEFQIDYPDEETYQLCDSILSALATEPIIKTDVLLELQAGENGWAILVNGDIQYAMEDHSSFADYLRTAILDALGSRLVNWISLHAAGILDNSGEAILFAAPSGSGKSTLSIELILQGFEYLGDDTQILDLDSQQIWPFPTAANLKEGSWPLFESRLPELIDTPIFRPDVRPVKFLPIKADSGVTNKRYKTKALIFPEYDSIHKEGTIEKVDLETRISLLSNSGCYSQVQASAEMSQKYIEYMLSLDAYQLQYSSSQQAIELLSCADLLN